MTLSTSISYNNVVSDNGLYSTIIIIIYNGVIHAALYTTEQYMSICSYNIMYALVYDIMIILCAGPRHETMLSYRFGYFHSTRTDNIFIFIIIIIIFTATADVVCIYYIVPFDLG